MPKGGWPNWSLYPFRTVPIHYSIIGYLGTSLGRHTLHAAPSLLGNFKALRELVAQSCRLTSAALLGAGMWEHLLATLCSALLTAAKLE